MYTVFVQGVDLRGKGAYARLLLIKNKISFEMNIFEQKKYSEQALKRFQPFPPSLSLQPILSQLPPALPIPSRFSFLLSPAFLYRLLSLFLPSIQPFLNPLFITYISIFFGLFLSCLYPYFTKLFSLFLSFFRFVLFFHPLFGLFLFTIQPLFIFSFASFYPLCEFFHPFFIFSVSLF